MKYEYWFIEYDGGMTEGRWLPRGVGLTKEQRAALDKYPWRYITEPLRLMAEDRRILSAVKLREVEQ